MKKSSEFAYAVKILFSLFVFASVASFASVLVLGFLQGELGGKLSGSFMAFIFGPLLAWPALLFFAYPLVLFLVNCVVDSFLIWTGSLTATAFLYSLLFYTDIENITLFTTAGFLTGALLWLSIGRSVKETMESEETAQKS